MSITVTRAMKLSAAFAITIAIAAPQTVPIVDLRPAKAVTTATFGGILGLREVTGGKLLVNDAGRRQLWLYDTTLATSKLVYDSVTDDPNGHKGSRFALQPYLGDSSLIADFSSGPGALLVLDEHGQVTRPLALPHWIDGTAFATAATGVDNQGRLYYALTGRISGTPAGQVGAQETFPDSLPILRADLTTRSTDTVGRVSKAKGEYTKIDHTNPDVILRTIIVNPLPEPDEWAVISDGSVAFVRGHDYHIDWVRPDGSTNSTPKLPFDWKRLTDDDKRKLIDSANAAHAAQNRLADSARKAGPPPPPPMAADAANGGAQRTGGGAGITRAAYSADGTLWYPLKYETVDVKDVSDYWPAIRQGAVQADRDNRLWILPTTSAQSKNGELVYDLVNTKGELMERVRVPLGRSIIGFGKGGVVYMQAGDRTHGFTLERTRLPVAK